MEGIVRDRKLRGEAFAVYLMSHDAFHASVRFILYLYMKPRYSTCFIMKESCERCTLNRNAYTVQQPQGELRAERSGR